jgi:FkbM family methyltransferase
MLRQLIKKMVPEVLWQNLRSMKIRSMIKDFKPFYAGHTYGGHTLRVKIADPLGKGWYDHDWQRLREIEIMSQGKLKTGAKVFDLGAHQGVVAMMLAKEVGNNGQVLAIEANPHNQTVAAENAQNNRMFNLQIVHAAVAESECEIEFNEDLNGAIASDITTTKTVKVKGLPIDHLMKAYFCPDVVFMDIEGYEVKALKGAEKVLDAKADWFIEVHEPEKLQAFGGSWQTVLDHFLKRNYKLLIGSEDGDFVPFAENHQYLRDRFFLIALSRS